MLRGVRRRPPTVARKVGLPSRPKLLRRIEARRGVSYSRHAIDVVQTGEFDTWIRKLKDRQGKLRILKRIDRLANGNPGDVAPVGRGVSELRLNVGPGYRVYYLQDGDALVLLLCGGDKSTQSNDIEQAHKLAEEWRADQQDGKQRPR
ncbi:type II toxin-antitoxin system RelE/ParE family toxin [Knoellia subterranea]|uniref:Addiction module antitoxin RelB n=1 Tax=Knoellia subterranea KCTC 19937 TaxID=1385521 RepID=A0A0A0JET9_9MICO|nr:type II toxin-antitoxin system RelE/ParE family toxin [Knoellia subterranea]KGN35314.1 addiction module antitoxin RelB [Knoellia subterranea KCTC 19937]